MRESLENKPERRTSGQSMAFQARPGNSTSLLWCAEKSSQLYDIIEEFVDGAVRSLDSPSRSCQKELENAVPTHSFDTFKYPLPRNYWFFRLAYRLHNPPS